MRIERLRNFSIIAHIDHGKSTLADRMIERTNAVSAREFREQFLDDMDLERERGITIKANHIKMEYSLQGTPYVLNLIDTPGHVDFTYEVSRSLTACEGVLLLVDASQGVEAQTVANCHLALDHDLEIIPVINKIDLPTARPLETVEELHTTLGLDIDDMLLVSAKTGEGVDELMQVIVRRIPPPEGDDASPLRALVFDSLYNDYKGVITYIRIFDGTLKPGMNIRLIQSRTTHTVTEVGAFKPKMTATEALAAGEVGYCVAGVKEIGDVNIGDTIAEADAGDVKALPGYKEPLPMVFCGLYPAIDTQVSQLRDALEKLRLNDSSFTFQPEHSEALGFGFRCGFLGLLHMEIIQERLERENDIALVQTAPNVTYEVLTTAGELLRVENPFKMPPADKIEEIREPVMRLDIISPAESIGGIMKLLEERRGTYLKTHYLSPIRVMLTYEVPFSEIIYDFYDRLKSVTRGYGTMDYHLVGFRPADLVKLDILVSGKKVDALSCILHRDKAEYRGRNIVRRLRSEIPRQLYEVVLQAGIGSRIITRETIKPLAKNVTAKCYGGDVTRKRKLLEKQKAGKKRMKSVGNVEIPQKAFLAILSGRDE
jgi:GTP-binding protein LepA